MRNTEDLLIESFYERLIELDVISEGFVLNLKDINLNDHVNDMVELEDMYFSDLGVNADVEDLQDDFSLNDFVGYGVFDNNTKQIRGYIYGYKFGEDVEKYAVNSMNLNKVNFYDNNFKKYIFNVGIQNVINGKTTFYVSNFVVHKNSRLSVIELIQKLINDVRAKGYKYLLFDGLSDTLKLFTDPRKSGRLSSVNLKILADIPSGYGSKITLMEI